MQVLTAFLSWFKPTPKRPRELIFVEYEVAEQLLAAQEGWRIAPEEDTNRVFLKVYLERDL